jgi:hypothetical protein
MRLRLLDTLFVATLAVAGCSSGPKYKIDDSVFAQIPINEKQGLLQAEQEKSIARQEHQKAEADLKQIERELDIAENEYKMAKLGVENAESSKKLAEQSGDVNRKNAAERDLRVAEMGKKAAQSKVDWLEKKRKWAKACREAAEEHQHAADAKYELEKARLAQQKGIKPSEDFNVANFETEAMEKDKKYTEARLDAEKLRPEVDSLERTFMTQNEQYLSARNMPR